MADRVVGVVLADGVEIAARAVVLTTGTFLNGIIHIGNQRRPGGRVGDMPRHRWPIRSGAWVTTGRLKTGTPPRLDGRSIDWARLEMQPGDDVPVLMSFLSRACCSSDLLRHYPHERGDASDYPGKSGPWRKYGGYIEGVGPRYCPSIEDKVVRFAGKDSHQVFLEPEGLDDHTVYPNGISTSLPVDVQEAYVRTISGLESAVIMQAGYAIEYVILIARSSDKS